MALRTLALLGILVCAPSLLSAADDEKPRRRVRIGGVMIGAGYSHWSGGYPFYPRFGYYPGFWGLYSPWYDPFFMTWLHPGFYSGFARQPGMGELKLKDAEKGADVYLDGAFAGSTTKLRSMWLEPGVYNLELRAGDRAYLKRIYVLSGRTLALRPELAPAGEKSP